MKKQHQALKTVAVAGVALYAGVRLYFYFWRQKFSPP